ncbi:MAG: DUF4258 domain-containing protein [Chloroflexota bacterium]
MSNRRVIFRIHAIQRMFERRVSDEAVKRAIQTGETIENYPEDRPYPSRLILGWHGTRPLHIVIADNEAENETIVITVYEPDPNQWSANFRSRK